jgi:hypothetical protein
VAGRVAVFPVEAAIQAERLAARGRGIGSEDGEFDPSWGESLDVQNVQALVEPIHEERPGLGAVSSDLARVALLDRRRVCQKGEDAEGDLRERLRQGRAAADDAPVAAGLDIGEGRAQE